MTQEELEYEEYKKSIRIPEDPPSRLFHELFEKIVETFEIKLIGKEILDVVMPVDIVGEFYPRCEYSEFLIEQKYTEIAKIRLGKVGFTITLNGIKFKILFSKDTHKIYKEHNLVIVPFEYGSELLAEFLYYFCPKNISVKSVDYPEDKKYCFRYRKQKDGKAKALYGEKAEKILSGDYEIIGFE